MPFVARRPVPDPPHDAPPKPVRLTYFSVREVRGGCPPEQARRARTRAGS